MKRLLLLIAFLLLIFLRSNSASDSYPCSINSIDYDENTVTLDLTSSKLSGLPDCVGDLKNLKILWLGGNQLQWLPESIGNLTGLEWLHLYYNHIDSIPKSILKLENLKRLLLSNNSITELPENIVNLKNLVELDLSHNQLTFIPENLNQLKNLKLLFLGGNPLKRKEIIKILEMFPETTISFSSFNKRCYKNTIKFQYKNNIRTSRIQYNSLNDEIIKEIYKYNSKGDIVEKFSSQEMGRWATTFLYKYKYDDNGNVTDSTEYRSETYQLRRGETKIENHRRVSYWEYKPLDKDGNVVDSIKRNLKYEISKKYTFQYDKKGNRIETNYYDSKDNLVTKKLYNYNGDGHIVGLKTFSSDSNLQYRYEYVYDRMGNRKEEILFNSKGKLEYKKIRAFNIDGNLIDEKYYDNRDSIISEYKTGYDSLGNQVSYSFYDKKNHDTTFSYYRYDKKGNIYKFEFDKDDDLESIVFKVYDEYSNLIEYVIYDPDENPDSNHKSVIAIFE